ncbi:hypothetical protein [Pseudactinotalea sp. Z1748]|uniref:hypothetical protein n=1 Tax=Pseudactinotalea sp. Z1748 TaxID=3413027 RepID=UPI003C7E48FF
MSIWATLCHIGTDYLDERPQPERGHVLTYAEGWSNHYPNLTGEAELPAMIGLAEMPGWCVPGHWLTAEDPSDGAYDHKGPWVRLDLHAECALNFWGDGTARPSVEKVNASIVLDEEAARSLRDDLDAWLSEPKAYPKEEQ